MNLGKLFDQKMCEKVLLIEEVEMTFFFFLLLQEKAVNVVEFNVAGFGLLSGSLTIEASYSVESPQVHPFQS